MASILDSFKELSSEKLSFIKILALVIPAYYSYYLFTQSKDDFSGFWVFAIITLFFVFGFVIQIAGNVINDKRILLPSMNPLTLAISSAKGIVGVGPIIVIFYFLANFICSFVNFIPWVDITLKTLIWLMAASMMITSFLMFSNSEKIVDAYKIKIIFNRSSGLILKILIFIVQLFLLNIVSMVFIGYVIYVLLGFSPIFDFFVTFAAVFNLAVFGHYWGQVHQEVLEFDNPN